MPLNLTAAVGRFAPSGVCRLTAVRWTDQFALLRTMPTIQLEIDPAFLGPMSVGTVSAIRLLAHTLGLDLKDAKDAVDACVFRGESVMFHVPSTSDGESLCHALSALDGPARIRATVLHDLSAVREVVPPSKRTPATFASPDLCALKAPLRAAFPSLTEAHADFVVQSLGRILYVPRRYLDCYHMGIITADELANVLVAHAQTEVAAVLSRWVETEEVTPLIEPVNRLLFPEHGSLVTQLSNKALLRTTALPRSARSGIRRRKPIR